MTDEEAPVVLATEEEVRMLSVASSRNPYQLLITRPGRDLGKKRNFVDRDSHLGTEGLIEFRSFKDPNFELVHGRLSAHIQSTPELSDATTQSR